MKNFFTMGTFGDTIYQLNMMKIMGGGNMYVKLDALDDFAKNVLGWQNAGPGSGRYTARDYQVLEPLLNHQDYINEVEIWSDQHLDVDFTSHYKYHLIDGHKGNQTECYALSQGYDIHNTELKSKLLYEPWLTPVEPIKVKNKPVVVNRTCRYLYGAPSLNWSQWFNAGYQHQMVFVGSQEEHASFEETFSVNIEYYKTEDLLHLCKVIQGCEMFIGNQSVALSLAIGLGKTYKCEIRKDYQNTRTPHGGYGDVWFPRINGEYF